MPLNNTEREEQDMLKIRNWTGTVHYTADGTTPACSPVATHSSWMNQTQTQVTCTKCISKFGEDHNHGIDTPTVDENVARRAAERAARQAARSI